MPARPLSPRGVTAAGGDKSDDDSASVDLASVNTETRPASSVVSADPSVSVDPSGPLTPFRVVASAAYQLWLPGPGRAGERRRGRAALAAAAGGGVVSKSSLRPDDGASTAPSLNGASLGGSNSSQSMASQWSHARSGRSLFANSALVCKE